MTKSYLSNSTHLVVANTARWIARGAEPRDEHPATPLWLLRFCYWMFHLDGPTFVLNMPERIACASMFHRTSAVQRAIAVETAIASRRVARYARFLERQLTAAGIDLNANPYPVGALLVVARAHTCGGFAFWEPLNTPLAARTFAYATSEQLEFMSLDRPAGPSRHFTEERALIDARLAQLTALVTPGGACPALVDRSYTAWNSTGWLRHQ